MPTTVVTPNCIVTADHSTGKGVDFKVKDVNGTIVSDVVKITGVVDIMV